MNLPPATKLARYIAEVSIHSLLGGAKKSTKYVSPDFVIKASRTFKASKHNTRSTVILTMGAPNYRERAFIKLCQKAGEPFPVKKVQLKFFK